MENIIVKESKENKPFYFKVILQKYTAFVPLLILALLCTVAYICDYYNVINIILTLPVETSYIVVTASAFVMFFCFYYFLSKIGSKNIYFGDVFFIPAMIFIAFYIIYCLLAKTVTLYIALPVFIAFPITVIFMFMRILFYYKRNSECVIKNKLYNYLDKFYSKFTFLLPLFIAFSAFIATYYFDNKNVMINEIKNIFNNKTYFYIGVSVIGIIFITCLIFTFFKNLHFTDFIINSMFCFSFLWFLNLCSSFFVEKHLDLVTSDKKWLYLSLSIITAMFLIMIIINIFKNKLFAKIIQYILFLIPLSLMIYLSIYNGIYYKALTISAIYFISFIALIIRIIRTNKKVQ